MRMPPLPADSIHARACKLKCEKILTRPVLRGVPGAQSVFGYKVLGRETDAGRVFTFWGRAREAA